MILQLKKKKIIIVILLNIKIEIKFPYELYDIQKNMIKQIIDSLINQKECVIESSTGTGKSIDILSTCLSYIESLKLKIRMIKKV